MTEDRKTDLSKEELLALGEAHDVRGLSEQMREDTLERKLIEADVPLPAADDSQSTGPQPPAPLETNSQDDSPREQDRGDEDGDAPGDEATASEPGDETTTGPQPPAPLTLAPPQPNALPERPRGDEGDQDPGGQPTAVSASDEIDEDEMKRLRPYIEAVLSERGLIGQSSEPAGPAEPTLLQQVRELPAASQESVSTSKAVKAAREAGADISEDDVLGITVHRASGPDGKATGRTGVVVIDRDGGKHPAFVD